MKNINIIKSIFAAVALAAMAAVAEPSVTDVVAKQRYPWNGLVDITCKVSGIDETTDGSKFTLACVNLDSGEVMPAYNFVVVKGGSNSTDRAIHANGFYRLLWDSTKDIGTGVYSNMVVRVICGDGHRRVQLWENGPYWGDTNLGAEAPWDDGGEWRLVRNVIAASNWGRFFAGTKLGTNHDNAYWSWGKGWRTPTSYEWENLISRCSWQYGNNCGKSGYYVRGKGDYASSWIFLPATTTPVGQYWPSVGKYWSSTLTSDLQGCESAWVLSFNIASETRKLVESNLEGGIHSIRPVSNIATTFESVADSEPMVLGFQTEPVVESILITWDAAWMGGDPIATVVIMDNGTEIKRAIGAGKFVHTFSSPGRHELTYMTYIDGVAQNEIYTATFYTQWKYREYGGGAVITGTTQNSASLTIPFVIDGLSVTGIETVGDCVSVASLTIPDSVKRIWSNAFANCNDLREVKGGQAVCDTPMYSMAPSVYNLITNVILYSSVTNIGDKAFHGCSALTSMNIPSGVTSIGESAFGGCSGLTSMNIPSGVTSIGESAFGGCSGLTNMSVPNSVTNIGYSAFSGCSGLEEITLPFVGSRRYVQFSVYGTKVKLFGYIFGSGGCDGCTETRQCYNSSYAWSSGWYCNYYIPSKLRSVKVTDEEIINHGAFYGCSGLTSVTIPDEVTSIGDYAFYGCSGLTSVTIPDEVTSIGDYAFYGCSGLTSVTIPDSVTSIGCEAFGGCSELLDIGVNAGNPVYKSVDGLLLDRSGALLIQGVNGDVKIPDGVTNIVRGAFSRCRGLTSVTIPDSVTCIGKGAFSGCSGLTSVTIPDSVTSIGDGAFSGCSGLTSVTIPDSVTSIGDDAFSGCSGLTSVTIPDSVTSIGSEVFYKCSGLKSVTIGNSVTSIGSYAFYGCSSLVSLTIGNGVTSIGSYAFYNCSVLTSVTIPKSVKNIDQRAFEGCVGLMSVKILDGVTSIGSYAFRGCDGLTSLTIPNSVMSIGQSAFSGCSGLEEITLPFVGECRSCSGSRNSLIGHIFGTSSYEGGRETMQYYSESSYVSYYIPSKLRRVVVTDETILGYGAFYGCYDLTSVTISSSVMRISRGAFCNCWGLEEITLPFVGACRGNTGGPDSVFGYIFGGQSLGASTCQYYSPSLSTTYCIPYPLRSVVIADETILGYGAFYGCDRLTNVTILGAVTSIGDRAFYGCRGLTSVAIPDGVVSIGERAFYGCTCLADVTVPGSVASIAESAFYDCGNLVDVYVSPGTVDRVKTLMTYSGFNIGGVSFTEVARVAFDANGVVLDEVCRYVALGCKIGELPEPTRLGYTFAGWWTSPDGGTQIAASTVVTGNMTCYAHWTAKYTVTFDANGGYGGKSVTQDCGTSLSAPTVTREGYTFTGWSPSIPATVPAANVTYIALWEANQYTLTFDANGGDGGTSMTLDYGAALAAPTVTREGYTFVGWSPDVPATVPLGDATYVAHWIEGVEFSDSATYCVIDLSPGPQAVSYPISYMAAPTDDGFNIDEYKTTKLVLRLIEPGAYKMCGTYDVILTKPFYCGIFEVTQKQYELVMGSNPSSNKGDKRPVEKVSWNMIRGNSSTYNWPSTREVKPTAFIGKLQSRTGINFDLPTEAQWEYACRAGTTSKYNNGGDSESDLKKLGRYTGNASDGNGGYSSYHTTVGSYEPNAWGLYDMHGNVWEWLLDWHGNLSNDIIDPTGASSGAKRGLRGGSSYNSANMCTSSYRDSDNPASAFGTVGFRLVRTGTISYSIVTFNLNDGSMGTANTVQLLAPNAALPNPAREGYTFDGWWTSASGGTRIINATDTISGTLLYAHWKVNRYTITFDANGGNGGTSVTLDYGAALTAPTVTREGYTFMGWSPDVPATVPASNVTYTAQWEINRYTVTFDANGGVGMTGSGMLTTNGWKLLSRDSDGTEEYQSASIGNSASTSMLLTLTGPYDLTFSWKVSSESGCDYLRWYLDGAEEAEISGTGGTWQDVCVSVPAGEHAVKWTYSKDGSTTRGSDCGWVRVPKIMPSVSLDHGQVVGDLPTPTRTGYTFEGWFTEATGGTQISASTVVTGNMTCYAHWTCVVTFNANGGSVHESSRRVVAGSAVGTLPTPTCTGYSFAGWWTAATGGTQISASTVVAGDMACYARWKAIYTVTFDANGGSVDESSRRVVADSTVGTLPTPTRTGYSFAGWWTSATGGTQISTSTEITGAVTYYAHWTCAVTFNANGGSVIEASRMVAEGCPVGTLPTPTRSGYIFDGWFTAESGGMQISASTVISCAVTYYAHWTWTDQPILTIDSAGVLTGVDLNGYTDIVIPVGVTSIGSSAFKGCSGLTSVTIPNSVTSIGAGAFEGCSGLEEITLPFVGACRGDAGRDDSLFGYIFGRTSYTGSTKTWQQYSSSWYAYYIPSSLRRVVVTDETVLGYGAFSGCSGLTSVTIPDSVTSIGSYAFSGCSLSSITIPSSVAVISESAFSECGNLKSVTIKEGVSVIGDDAFRACGALKTINLPSSVRIIGDTAFANSGLTSMTLPQGVGNIGYATFANCLSLASVTVPSSVKSIEYDAFVYCSALKAVTYLGNCPDVSDGEIYYGTPSSLVSYVPAGDATWAEALAAGTWMDRAIKTGTEAKTYTVQFHKYDGSGATAEQTFKVGETKSLLWMDSQLKWTREGYEFIGWVPWNPDSKPRLCKYVNGQKVKDLAKEGETVHLWAAWKSSSSYRVCFNRNDGSGEKMNQVILRNKEDTLAWLDSQLEWTRPGYTFKGWAETATGAVKYANGAKVKNLAMNGGTKNLYAVWKSNEYTVQFHKYDGSGTTKEQTFKVGETKSLLWLDSQLKWSREGYEFIGWVPWNPDSKPRLCKYVNGEKVKDLAKPGETVHLWCGWKSSSSYRVCFNKNDGSGAKLNQVILRNKEDTLAWLDSLLEWTREGYTFQGWAETATGAVKYANGAKVKNLAMNGGTKNLYAVWKAVKKSVKMSAFFEPVEYVAFEEPGELPGMVVEGETADGGTFRLVIGEDGAAVLYLFDGEGWAEEKCEVAAEGGVIAVAVDGGVAYRVTLAGEVPLLE